jgi:chitinase
MKAARALFVILFLSCGAYAQQPFRVIAYYAGGPEWVDSVAANKLTHINYSFCHLKGNRLNVDDARDTLTIQRLVELKKINPDLKVLLSLGGWGGCKTCSDVFATASGRKEFAKSAKQLADFFHTDGVDLDWEYPTISGYPGHTFAPHDKADFSALVKQLRKVLGKTQLITFAAGGFQKYFDESVDWSTVMKYVDFVNLMTYDLVGGNSPTTGHHTALYSTSQQSRSVDYAVEYLVNLNVPRDKLIIGAAIYGRMFENVPSENHGLYQPAKFKAYVPYKRLLKTVNETNGFTYYWDDAAKAPFYYNAEKQLFVTFENKESMGLKTKYALENHLGGIMFWQITSDLPAGGLVDIIDSVRKGKTP